MRMVMTIMATQNLVITLKYLTTQIKCILCITMNQGNALNKDFQWLMMINTAFSFQTVPKYSNT
jgi:hypothetical protein